MLKTYTVNPLGNQTLTLTGKGDDTLWSKANVLTDFSSPWENTKIDKIEFRALWNTRFLYFNFKVFDTNIHIANKVDKYDSINHSDRVELFFRSDENLHPYYCLEIDPTPRLMDFKAEYCRNFDFKWNWPSTDIAIKSFVFNDCFVVEGAISLTSLKALKLLKGNKIETGVFRAKYHKQPDGSYQPTWMPWVNPNTETPDFHTPSAFGVFNLVGLG